MSKIITEVDKQIESAKLKFEAAKTEMSKTVAPIQQLMRAADEQVAWAEFAIIELKDRLTSQEISIAALQEENAKLRAFKEYVHKRLDEAGVPQFPNGPHSKEGCRVGDRLDIALRGDQ